MALFMGFHSAGACVPRPLHCGNTHIIALSVETEGYVACAVYDKCCRCADFKRCLSN